VLVEELGANCALAVPADVTDTAALQAAGTLWPTASGPSTSSSPTPGVMLPSPLEDLRSGSGGA
jgi:hypothetical protein